MKQFSSPSIKGLFSSVMQWINDEWGSHRFGTDVYRSSWFSAIVYSAMYCISIENLLMHVHVFK